MVAATIVGLAQNAVRSNPMDLFPKVQKPSLATSPTTDPATDAPSAMDSLSAAGAVAGEVSGEEIARGELSKDRLKAIMDTGTAIIIDARSENEYAEGHVRGALNIPYESFVDHYRDLEAYVPMDATVICYCRSVTCDLSDHLAQELRLMGYEKVLLYRGGWDEWIETGYPVETGAPAHGGENEK